MFRLTKKLLMAGAVGALAATAGRAIIRSRRWFDFNGKTVLITGGSRGLGLVLARRLLDLGANVAICARTSEDIKAAESELVERGGKILTCVCDVSDQEQVNAMVDRVVRHFGTIDVLFNVAGIIQVGPLDAMTADDFHNAMAINCWGALYTALAVAPGMRRKGWGRIVNVTSIGGKQAVPHMLPYTVSKFAQVGLSHGLRTELAKDGIVVTTICPSLLRTGSPRNAIFKGQNHKEYTWFSISDALPIVSMNAERAVEQMVRACQNGDDEVILRNPANIAVLAQSAFPGTTRSVLSLLNRLLPEMAGSSDHAARGYESHSDMSPSWLTQLNEEAAQQNNQMGLHPIRPK